MSYDAIRVALDARLNGLPAWDVKRIAWPNVKYEPLGGESYLQVSFAVAEPRQFELGDSGRNLQRGIYTVSVVSPPGHGIGDALRIADGVRSHFKRGIDLSAGAFAVTLIKAWAAPSFPRDGWLVTPVTITWQALTPN